MGKDITELFKMGDIVDVVLNKPLTPHCMGSETALSERPGDSAPVTSVMGEYAGSRPGLIKVNPIDGGLLDAPRSISRYVVVDQAQVKEAYVFEAPISVFP